MLFSNCCTQKKIEKRKYSKYKFKKKLHEIANWSKLTDQSSFTLLSEINLTNLLMVRKRTFLFNYWVLMNIFNIIKTDISYILLFLYKELSI